MIEILGKLAGPVYYHVNRHPVIMMSNSRGGGHGMGYAYGYEDGSSGTHNNGCGVGISYITRGCGIHCGKANGDGLSTLRRNSDAIRIG